MSNTKYAIIHHGSCNDGLMSAVLMMRYLMNNGAFISDIACIPAYYGKQNIWDDEDKSEFRQELEGVDVVYIVDFTLPPEDTITLLEAGMSVHVYDHHKTAPAYTDPVILYAQKYLVGSYVYDQRENRPTPEPCFSATIDTSCCGASLVAKHFFKDTPLSPSISRIITLVESYDIFKGDYKSDAVRRIQLALNHLRENWILVYVDGQLSEMSVDMWSKLWNQTNPGSDTTTHTSLIFNFMLHLFSEELSPYLERLGSNLLDDFNEQLKINAMHLIERKYNGITFYSPSRPIPLTLVSALADYIFTVSHTDSPVKNFVYWNGSDVSLRSDKTAGEDVSEIAISFGGGGHPNAAGFPLVNGFKDIFVNEGGL